MKLGRELLSADAIQRRVRELADEISRDYQGIERPLILLSVLKRVRLAVLAFVTLPIALVGGIIGNYVAGGVISIGSLVGFFTVLGIVARNGIMMITHFQHLEREEGVPFGPGLVIQGARERGSTSRTTLWSATDSTTTSSTATSLPCISSNPRGLQRGIGLDEEPRSTGSRRPRASRAAA